MHKVHRPAGIGFFRHCQRCRFFAHQPFPGFYPQVELQFPINPVYPLVVPAKPFDVAQIEKAEPEAPVALAGCDAQQPIGDELVLFGQYRLVAIAAFADPEHPAGEPDGDGAVSNGLGGHLASGRWRHHFFAMASWRMSALRRSSAYIFLRRRFSSSKSLRRAMREASMPPNLARHL